MKRKYAILPVVLLLASCVEVSSGLKIFVTDEIHAGDFANDPTLVGTTSIEKADDFCNKSTNKPDDAQYKALLVDGVERDAVSRTDWVLQPNTIYYQNYDHVEIGTTNNSAIFPVSWAAFNDSILPASDIRYLENIEQINGLGLLG